MAPQVAPLGNFPRMDKDDLVVSGAAQIRKWVRPENSSRLRSDRLNAVGS